MVRTKEETQLIALRPFKTEHLTAVLDLIEKSDSTNRSIDTWTGNSMTAVMAFDDSRLIGVLPLEKRLFSLGGNRYIDALWISGVHVEPRYRSQGIGTLMNQKIREYFLPKYKAIFVYRGDETSRAYNWYKKLGYHELLSIISFKNEVRQRGETADHVTMKTETEICIWEDKIYDCFNRNSEAYGGFPKRHHHFWTDKLKTHYYKTFYTYSIVALKAQDKILGYAFLGQTAMKDNIPRVDILEFIAPEDPIIKSSLYNAIMKLTCQSGASEVRIQLSAQDPHLQWIESLGFIRRWRFNIMGRLIDPMTYLKEYLSEKIDLLKDYQFIIQTPELGEYIIGVGKNRIKLFTNDNLLNEILLCRCDISDAIKEGRIKIIDGNENNIADIFKEFFPLNKWLYFHVDYV